MNDNSKKTFIFTYKGGNAEEIAERFAAYFWDGGFDQFLEQEFLNQFGLDLDSVTMDGFYGAVVDTDKAKM